jgi:LDH2 family malate/lactate/ureidoglycolate dehydrogenase
VVLMGIVRVRPGDLRQLSSAVFEALGAPADVAAQVAAALIDANLTGHDSHGVIRIAQYVGDVDQGAVRPRARTRVMEDNGCTALVSGEWGFGHATGHFAIKEAIRRAQEHKVAAIGVVRCNHLGRMGAYAEQAAEEGCAFVSFVGGIEGAHQAVPYGGARSAYGANPFTGGFPAGAAGPVVVDFATTAIAGGKVLVAHAAGEELPPGNLVDANGRPTTSPAALLEGGALLPFGGHKGYGLAVIAELLGQALTGSDLTGEEGSGGDVFRRSGALFVAISCGAFRSADEGIARAESFVRRLRAIPPAPGFDRVRTPGEPESAQRELRSRKGVELAEETWGEIRAVAERFGLEGSLPTPLAVAT